MSTKRKKIKVNDEEQKENNSLEENTLSPKELYDLEKKKKNDVKDKNKEKKKKNNSSKKKKKKKKGNGSLLGKIFAIFMLLLMIGSCIISVLTSLVG